MFLFTQQEKVTKKILIFLKINKMSNIHNLFTRLEEKKSYRAKNNFIIIN